MWLWIKSSISPNFESAPNAAKARRARKKKCEMVWAMNLLTGQRSFAAICRQKTFADSLSHYPHISVHGLPQGKRIWAALKVANAIILNIADFADVCVLHYHCSFVTVGLTYVTKFVYKSYIWTSNVKLASNNDGLCEVAYIWVASLTFRVTWRHRSRDRTVAIFHFL